ncbi:hypothetical protein GYMLUDRAFT_240664 [Collybiopsis luxurians FD-317 M1]|nr:hypothetical protein GYMLUDRAFT_240664 [Collybiopsis luxurians FD-317 M1]
MDLIQTEMRLPPAAECGGLEPVLPDDTGESMWSSSLDIRDQTSLVNWHCASSDTLQGMHLAAALGLSEPGGASGSAIGQGSDEGVGEHENGDTADLESSKEIPGCGRPAQPLNHNLVAQEHRLQDPHIEVTDCDRDNKEVQSPETPHEDILNNEDTQMEFVNGLLEQINARNEEMIRQQNAEQWIE